jgi:hypothetical protein
MPRFVFGVRVPFTLARLSSRMCMLIR